MPEPAFINDRYVRTEQMLAMIRRVLVRMLLATALVAALGSGISALIVGMPGVWGTLIAAAIGLFFTGTTVALLYLVVGRGPELLQIVLLGGWIVKMAVVFVLLLWLRQLEFYDRMVFIIVIMVLAVTLLIVELVTVVTARIPYVDPSARAHTSADSAAADSDTTADAAVPATRSEDLAAQPDARAVAEGEPDHTDEPDRPSQDGHEPPTDRVG